MSDFDSDLASDFVAITGATLEEANTWLEIGGFVLQEAVNLYFSSKSNDAVPSTSASAVGNEYRTNDYDEDEIRRPDEVKRRRLLDFSYERINNISKIPRATSAFSAGSNFVPKNEKEATLSKIFKAPVELITNDNFDDILEIAKEQDKWLIANIQTDSEFQCHTLNRDFWGDESIKDLILVSSLFWQHFDVTSEGIKYVNRYKISQYPHIAIIDPRTGAIAWRHDGRYDLKLLMEKFQDFLTQQSCPSESRLNTKLRRFATTSSSSSLNSHGSSHTAAGTGFGTTAVDEEDPEMEEAIRLSLQQQSQPQQQAVPSLRKEDGVTSGDLKLSGFQVKDCLRDQKSSSSSSSSGGGIRTVFRLPSGSKVNHSFSSEALVMEVATFAAEQLCATGSDETVRFEVFFNFPQQALSEVPDLSTQTLSSANILTGTAFTVRLL